MAGKDCCPYTSDSVDQTGQKIERGHVRSTESQPQPADVMILDAPCGAPDRDTVIAMEKDRRLGSKKPQSPSLSAQPSQAFEPEGDRLPHNSLWLNIPIDMERYANEEDEAAFLRGLHDRASEVLSNRRGQIPCQVWTDIEHINQKIAEFEALKNTNNNTLANVIEHSYNAAYAAFKLMLLIAIAFLEPSSVKTVRPKRSQKERRARRTRPAVDKRFAAMKSLVDSGFTIAAAARKVAEEMGQPTDDRNRLVANNIKLFRRRTRGTRPPGKPGRPRKAS